MRAGLVELEVHVRGTRGSWTRCQKRFRNLAPLAVRLEVDAEVEQVALVRRDAAVTTLGTARVFFRALAEGVVTGARGRVRLSHLGELVRSRATAGPLDREVRVRIDLERASRQARTDGPDHEKATAASETADVTRISAAVSSGA